MTTARTIKKIKSLRLSEISFVPEGDDPGAEIICKRKGDTMSKTIAELEADFVLIEKTIGEKDTLIATLTGERDAAIAKIKAVEGERDQAIEKAKPADTEEDILKGVSPAVREMIEKTRRDAAASHALVEKMASDREMEGETAIAKSLKVGSADTLAPLLHRIRKGKTTEADHATVVDILKQASTISKDSPLFKSAGAAAGGDADDPEAKLDMLAKDIQKAKPALTYAQAYTEAMDANPKLYGEVIAKKRAA